VWKVEEEGWAFLRFKDGGDIDGDGVEDGDELSTHFAIESEKPLAGIHVFLSGVVEVIVSESGVFDIGEGAVEIIDKGGKMLKIASSAFGGP